MLANSSLIAFAATTDIARAKTFFGEILGLELVADESFTLVFDAGGTMLRISMVDQFVPAPYTVLGWIVEDIGAVVQEIGQNGVSFDKYPDLKQDQSGICTFENGDRVAWFPDPDGNTLSLTQFTP